MTEDAPERTQGAAPAHERKKPLVLIVDDDPLISRLLSTCLAPEYDAHCAFDGDTGLAQALSSLPDLIIVDLVLPGMSGPALIRALRMRTEMSNVPILVLTGAGDPSQVADLFECGVQDFLRKPFLVPELIARVRNLVSAKRTRDVLNETIGRRETDLVKLARQVAQKQEDLQRVLMQLEEARKEAETADRIKTNFLRMMSHELKTPVTTMQLHMRLLERDPDIGLSPKLRDGIERMARSSRKLLHLVDTMLEWARVESGRTRLAVEGFDLLRLCREVAEEGRGYARQKAIELQVKSPDEPFAPLQSDRRLTRLLLVDLLSRAIQVTESGVIEITLSSDRDEQRVSIRDRAERLSAEEYREICEPFERTSELYLRTGAGSGLGLQVVRDLARAVSASVVLEPYDGQGNVLTLILPSLPLGTQTLLPAGLGHGATAH